MSRIKQIKLQSATGEARELLGAVKSTMGMVPNLLRIYANSPTALKAYLNFSGALQEGTFTPQEQEQIALVVAEANRCAYCLSVHSAFGKLAGLSEEETLNARKGFSSDRRISAMLQFALKIVEKRGFVGNEDLEEARHGGLTNEEITECVAHVAFNIYTTYFSHVVEADVDFPLVNPI